MRVAGPALAKLLRPRSLVTFAGAAALVSSCVVYTPDLLHDDAVSLGGRATPTASPGATGSPKTPVPTASSHGLPAPANTTPGALLQNDPRVQLERQKLAPEQLGALVEAPTGEWVVDSGYAEVSDAATSDSAAP